MSRPSPGRNKGGRPPGSPNKATIERNLELAREVARKAGQPIKASAKQILEDFMHVTAGMAAHYQPTVSGQSHNPNANETKFWEAAHACREFATALAPYQGPKFKAIQVMMAPAEPVRGGDGAKLIGSNVVDLADPQALMRVYKLRIKGTVG